MKKTSNINWVITIVPLAIVLAISALLLAFTEQTTAVIEALRGFFVNDFGFFYIFIGLAAVLGCVWLGFSKYGNVKLGNLEKPRYSTFSWGAMIFTSTMAADILYWSLHEWMYYFNETPFGMQNMTLVEKQDWASTYPLFHWGVTPWAFYILPAVAYGYMMHVKKRHRQTLSEACRPILGKRSDGAVGKTIDIFSVVGLLAGTATTFSLATPLLSLAITTVLGVPASDMLNKLLTIGVLLVIAAVYTIAVVVGMKGISKLATICVVVFCLLAAIFFVFGPSVYIIESGITGIGKMINEFFNMSTWMDPSRAAGTYSFPQNWTVFFWAYWIAWCVATPFFIGKISEGRTIRQTVFGGLACGIAGTYTSFIIFGNYGLFQQVTGKVDLAGMLANGASASEVIVEVFNTLPIAKVALVVLVVSMISFYASTFDALTYVVAQYSMKKLGADESPSKGVIAFWSAVFVILPIALIFTGSKLDSLTTLVIVFAFPIALILILVVASFLKDIRKDYKEKKLEIKQD